MMQWTEQNSDMAGSQAAMIRAARRAREVARQNNQPLVLWQDGKVVEVMPDDLPPLPDEAPEKTE
jgi:hypothetical protein